MGNRIISIFSVALVTLLGACGGGGGSTPTPIPTSVTVTCPNSTSKTATTTSEANALCAAPLLLTISPTDKASSVSVDTTSIDVTTDSTLDLSSLTTTNITLKAGTIDVVGTVAAVGTKAFKFSITGKLNYAQPYNFSASVKDTLGRALAVNGIFTTASISCVSPQVPNSTGTSCETPVVSQAVACSVAKHAYGDVTYPDSYKGAFAIPVPNQKLPTNVIRSVGFKDYYPIGLLPDSLCIDRTLHARNLYLETLDRLQQLGADQVWIYNYGLWDDFSKPIFSVSKSDWQIPESEVIFIVNEAKKRNIKVFQHWQFFGADKNGKFPPDDGRTSGIVSPEWDTFIVKVMNTWHSHIVEQAKFAEQVGIAGISADWQAFYIPNVSTTNRVFYLDQINLIIDDIRNVYRGKVIYGGSWGDIVDNRILAKIDALILNVGWNPFASVQEYLVDSTSMLAEIKKRQLASMKSLSSISELQNLAVPVIWFTQMPSKYDMTFWSEDGFCTNNCIQLTYKTDFSIQSLVIEASLEAVSEQPYFNTYGMNIENYWLTDDITPTHWGKKYMDSTSEEYDFPNLSPSIRNKPAEGIVKYWFSR